MKNWLEISRDDVPSDRIVDYGPKQFLKIPIAKYLEMQDISPIPSQIALINAVNNPAYRFVVAALSRRQGKTFIANVIAQLVSLVPNCNVLIIAPNYALSQISFELQRKMVKEFGIELVRDNLKDKVLELGNGSTVRMGSVGQVDSCVGRSYDLIVFDEAALSDGMDAFNVALRPTLDRPGSKAIFISTPRGRTNWFSTLFHRGFSSEHSEWISLRAPWQANPRMTEADVEEARRIMSRAQFKQEYEADFSQFEGQIWNFDREANCYDLSDLDTSKMEMIAGLDFGARDPTAFVVIAYDYEEDVYYALAEYKKAMRHIAKHAEALTPIIEKYDIEMIYADAAALQTRLDLANEHDITTIAAKKSRVDGINCVAAIIDNDRLKVDPKCVELLAALDSYRWDPNPNLVTEKPIHDKYSHMADALRYALYSFNTSTGTV